MSLAAVMLVPLGILHLTSGRHRLIQRNCETAQQWMELGPIRWAVVNGSALGVGFMSRIGFLAWYLVPLASFGFGDPALGAVIFGAYGGTRGLAVWAWLWALRGTDPEQPDPVDRVIDLNAGATKASAAWWP